MADFNDILPSGVDIRAIELSSVQPTVRTTSLSGRQQVRSFGGQYYSATITMPLLSEKDLRTVYAFLIKQRGGRNSFTIAPTNLKNVSGTQGTSVGCGAGTIGNTTIALDSGTGLYKAGDMIKFSGHSKAYMIVIDQPGTTTITFEPPLTTTVASSETIKSGSTFEMTVRLTEDAIGYSLDESGYGEIEFKVVEAV